MKINFLDRFNRDVEVGGDYTRGSDQEINTLVTEKEEFIYPLSFTEWMKEFGVSSKFEIDTATEEDIKQLLAETERKRKNLIITNALKYNRNNQNKYVS